MKTHYEQCSVRHDEDAGPSDPKVPKQSVLAFIPTNKNFKHELNLQITRYIVATGTSFRAIKIKRFKALVQNLRPGTET